MKRCNISIQEKSEGAGSGTLVAKEIENLAIIHDRLDGKDLIVVKVNDEVVFRYDANCKGESIVFNHIQMSIEEYENNKLK